MSKVGDFCMVQRTIPNISQFFAPLEEAIREKFIPAMVGRNISDIERRIFAFAMMLPPNLTTRSKKQTNTPKASRTPLKR